MADLGPTPSPASSPDEPTLDVVIVTYKSRPLIDACLGSLYAHAPAARAMQVWVAENDSGDGVLTHVREAFPQARTIDVGYNSGFSVANNLALKEGQGEYVLLLNPDCEMRGGVLDHLLELMASRPEIGIAGPTLEKEDGEIDHACRRQFPTLLGALGHFSGLGRRSDKSGRLSQYRAVDAAEGGPVDAVNGAFMLIRRSALDKVGLLDEGYWMYGEDLDLCYRFKQAGFVTWYDPSVTVGHVKAASSGSHRAFKLNWAFHYAMIRFYRKFYAREHNPLVNLLVYAAVLAKFALSATKSVVHRARGAKPQEPVAQPEVA